MVVRAAALALFLALLAACSSTDAGYEQPAGETSRAPTLPTNGSPLVELIGFSSDSEVNREQFAALQQQGDELVVACMRQHGFVWQPTPPLPGTAFAPGNRNSLAWARSHGLGISDRFTLLGRSAPDPNAEYVNALNESDQMRWQVALWGDTSALETDSDQPVVYAPAGCLGDAFAATRPMFEVYQEFDEELRTLDNRIKADPRLTNQTSAWAECMNLAGHAYSDEEEMNSDILNRLFAIPGVEQTLASSSTAPLNEVDQTALNQLIELERTIAVAHVDCVASTYGDIEQIRATYEREFIVDHRPRLEDANARIRPAQ